MQDDKQTLRTIANLAEIRCTQAEAAGVLDVCDRTFIDFLQSNKKARETWDFGRDQGKVSLRRLQWKAAQKSTTMPIWLGKQ